jgi:hypothetical protein
MEFRVIATSGQGGKYEVCSKDSNPSNAHEYLTGAFAARHWKQRR